MFYSSVVLSKKGPLGQLWMAAHFQDRKFSRPQIFATDINASVDSIVHPQVPLALRVSGHLLLGVVRIYSKKVHFLWQDCHQAMTQIQMAFVQQQQSKSPHDQTVAVIDMDPSTRGDGGDKTTMSGRRRKTRGGDDDDEDFDAQQMATLMVPTTAFQGFGIPFDLNDESLENAQDWVPAELDKDDEDGGNAAAALGLPTQDSQDAPNAARAAADMTLDDTFMMDGRPSSFSQAEEQQWTAFDPDDDGDDVAPAGAKTGDDEDDAPPLPDDDEDEPMLPADDDDEAPMLPGGDDAGSLEAEVPRANESLASEPETGRPSALENASIGAGRARMSEAEFSLPQDVSGIGHLDDEDEGPGIAGRASSLNLDQSSAASLHLDEGSTAAVSLGDGSAGSKRKSSSADETESPKKKRRRARKRKIKANQGHIELTAAQMRNMLNDTSDIVNRPPPLGEEEEAPNATNRPDLYGLIDYGADPVLMNYLSYEQLFARPAFADDGECAPELLQIWKDVARLRDFAPEQSADDAAEVPRQQDAEDTEEEEEDEMKQPARDEQAPSIDDEEEPFQAPDDDEEAPPVFPDDEEEAPPLPEDDEEEESPGARQSSLSLGLVNSFGDEEWGNMDAGDEGDTRQSVGDELVSSNSKWHKHTIKVFSLLKSRLGDAEGMEPHLSYNALTEGCERRTAVNVYFELLQLKTWDFIELNQDEPYGDIIVSPGPKFAEDVPK